MEKAKAACMDAGSPTPCANSPRSSGSAAGSAAAGIKELGSKAPTAVDGENAVVNGHTRPKAARKLGPRQAPAIVADGSAPEQAKAPRLADSKTGELAERGMGRLRTELEGIDIDMGELGLDGALGTSDGMEPIDGEEIGDAMAQERKMELDGSAIALTEGEHSLIRSKPDQCLDANGVGYGSAGRLADGNRG